MAAGSRRQAVGSRQPWNCRGGASAPPEASPLDVGLPIAIDATSTPSVASNRLRGQVGSVAPGSGDGDQDVPVEVRTLINPPTRLLVRGLVREAEQLELELLERLPCGCVAAVHRARPWPVTVMSLEAKGPHCILPGHRAGRVLRLGDPLDWSEEDDEGAN